MTGTKVDSNRGLVCLRRYYSISAPNLSGPVASESYDTSRKTLQGWYPRCTEPNKKGDDPVTNNGDRDAPSYGCTVDVRTHYGSGRIVC